MDFQKKYKSCYDEQEIITRMNAEEHVSPSVVEEHKKIMALAEFLGIDEKRIRISKEDWRSELMQDCLYLVDDQFEFVVADRQDSYDLAREQIVDRLYLFDAKLLAEHSFKDVDTVKIDIIKDLQERYGEQCNSILDAMLFSTDEFVRELITKNGEEAYLADFDGMEHKGLYDFNIYCMDTDEVETDLELTDRDDV